MPMNSKEIMSVNEYVDGFIHDLHNKKEKYLPVMQFEKELLSDQSTRLNSLVHSIMHDIIHECAFQFMCEHSQRLPTDSESREIRMLIAKRSTDITTAVESLHWL
jgi:hypothetical protein